MSGDVNLGFSVTHDEMASFMKALQAMQAKEVLAGFPADETPRQATPEDTKEGKQPITNAALGYIHNTGMPEQNIPARPFMVEGIESKGDQIANGMEAVGMAALDGNAEAVNQGLHAVGIIAKVGIQTKIVDGPFVPLAESTLKARARMGGSVGSAAQRELDSRAAGNSAGVDEARPLNLTGQMRNAVNYVVREN